MKKVFKIRNTTGTQSYLIIQFLEVRHMQIKKDNLKKTEVKSEE